MRQAAFIAIATLGLTAQSVDRLGLTRQWTDLGAPTSAQLRLNLDSGGYHIRASEDGKVRVRYAGSENPDLSRVRLRFRPSGGRSEFQLSNTPENGFQVEIQVPRATGLSLRMSAGEVTIQGIEGDKDLELQAGELKVQVAEPASYGPVSGSVWAGSVHPGPFGGSKEGLFRTFTHRGPGRYALQAKVKVGELVFTK